MVNVKNFNSIISSHQQILNQVKTLRVSSAQIEKLQPALDQLHNNCLLLNDCLLNLRKLYNTDFYAWNTVFSSHQRVLKLAVNEMSDFVSLLSRNKFSKVNRFSFQYTGQLEVVHNSLSTFFGSNFITTANLANSSSQNGSSISSSSSSLESSNSSSSSISSSSSSLEFSNSSSGGNKINTISSANSINGDFSSMYSCFDSNLLQSENNGACSSSSVSTQTDKMFVFFPGFPSERLYVRHIPHYLSRDIDLNLFFDLYFKHKYSTLTNNIYNFNYNSKYVKQYLLRDVLLND